ncbi:MAG TPA: cobalamin-dependent protein [Stellaceae bacterium]|nr:cobalamin-dependent protein [Stellaceae bacterium]
MVGVERTGGGEGRANGPHVPFEIGLVQINNSFSGQNYLPYSVALLEAYARHKAADPARYRFRLPIYKRIRIGSAVEQLQGCDIVGFSTYVWNGQISLEIARRLKRQQPDVLIVFGGPHVPDQPEAFLRANPFIDIAVHNEGEQTFLRLLERFPERHWADIPGVSFLAPDGSFTRNTGGPRFRDLDEVPSPFLSGALDPIMRANPDETWIGLWETNRGCPFQCTFCDWGSATAAKVTKFGIDRLFAELDWFAQNKIEYIFCCDANFGIQKRDVEIAEYAAKRKAVSGYPKALSVQNTKNATERAYLTQKILSDAGLNKGVALSMQSVDATALASIKRDNISLETYMELQRRFTRDGVETYSDLILGLPGETYDSFSNGVQLLIETGQHNRIQFNNLSILPNAEMGDPAYQKKYGMVTVESKIINIHGERVELEDDVPELQDLVVATHAMPAADWRRTRAFCWITALLHFDKLFQIPLIVAHELSGAPYREMLEAFLDVDGAEYPLLGKIRDFFLAEARAIQEGAPEYVFSEAYLGIYWPADEYMFIKLTDERQFEEFYRQAGRLLKSIVTERCGGALDRMLDDALRLNRALVKQPFVGDNTVVETSSDLMSFYNAIRQGEKAALRTETTKVLIDRSSQTWNDFQTWCREVVWWGNKKGAYLYHNRTVEAQLAGHF